MSSTELLEMCRTNLYDTDKFSTDNTAAEWARHKHSYVEYVYGEKFKRIRNAKNVLEIGIFNGGSHLLWRDYFPEATVYGIDIKHCSKLDNEPRIIQFTKDAYRQEVANEFADEFFDLIIDDGPHNLPSMLSFIQFYLPKLSNNGIMVIEDISELTWLNELSALIPLELREHSMAFDIREVDNKQDSILLLIDKGEMNG